jgi:hypothetical protein
MAMGIEKAYATLKDNPPMTQKVSSNPASPFQGIAMLAQQYQNQTNKKEIPMPMQSVLQQQTQPTTFAKGDKVKAKSPDHAIDLQIAKQFGTNIPPKLKAILKAGAAHTIATGKPDPGHLRAVLREASKLPPEIQAKFAPQFAAAKAALAKATGVAGISKFAEGDKVAKADVEKPSMREAVEELAGLYKSDGLSPEMAQMMQMAQEGKQRQGLASVIGAALTGAATPHALQAGQNSAMMAGEAADKGIASLQAGQDAMMGKAAEIEGAPTKNWNTALGAVFNAEQEKAKYGAELAKAQTAANVSRANKLDTIQSTEEMFGVGELGKNTRAQEANKVKQDIAKNMLNNKTVMQKMKGANMNKLQRAAVLNNVTKLVSDRQKAFQANAELTDSEAVFDQEQALKESFDSVMKQFRLDPNMFSGIAGLGGMGEAEYPEEEDAVEGVEEDGMPQPYMH